MGGLQYRLLLALFITYTKYGSGIGYWGGGGGKPPTTGIPVVYKGRGHSYIYSDLLEIEGRLYLRAVTKENLSLLLSTVTKTTGH